MGLKFRSERGASAVEFAIVLPVLVLLVFGIIEFSILLYDKAMVTNASREGGRVGIVFNVDGNGNYTPVDDNQIRNTVIGYLSNNLISLGNPAETVSIPPPIRTPNPLTGNLSPGGELTVSVSYTYTFLVIPNFIVSIINPITLTAQTVMRFE